MLSRSGFLLVILLPLVASAGEAQEQLLRKGLYDNHHLTEILPSHQQGSLPPSLLFHLLRIGSEPVLITPNTNADDSGSSGEAVDSTAPSSSSSSSDEEEEENTSEEILVKRVFCNAFTGCGGRHRDRNRRQERNGKRFIPVLVKRPFCNPHGCYNGKRAQASALEVPRVDPQMHARLLAEYLASAKRESVVSHVYGKRPFCNGYGGCRGGKRTVFSSWLPKLHSVAMGTR
ncbi:conoCAP-like [Pomacea canaliculata]|uniref:conoCAP-like n=1 Tax=Pomacea canaliculata TaxID=400727 RepID=UPI000D73D28E|nr:conoCAP-like [Pomacea canaliculata]XP_025096118.1 conoCAP-like [Pomacea canaliculata]